jgi:chemotaxis signal transduction protein
LECLVCRSDAVVCAIPLQYVAEVMRMLPLERPAELPPQALGISVIRGARIPVIDAAGVFGIEPSSPSSRSAPASPTRVVRLTLNDRSVGLAFDDVIGVRSVDSAITDRARRAADGAPASITAAVQAADAILMDVLRSIVVLSETDLRTDGRESRA